MRDRSPVSLDIQVGGIERVILDEFTPWLDLVTHQGGKDFVSRDGVLDLYLQQSPRFGIQGGFP